MKHKLSRSLLTVVVVLTSGSCLPVLAQNIPFDYGLDDPFGGLNMSAPPQIGGTPSTPTIPVDMSNTTRPSQEVLDYEPPLPERNDGFVPPVLTPSQEASDMIFLPGGNTYERTGTYDW